MKFLFLLIAILTASLLSYSQHCPWDCSGMILIQTNIAEKDFKELQVILVDENHQPITDTIFGTGLATYDPAEFMSYKDFTDYRTKKIALHQWYAYDTVYHFAEGLYLVKFNFCEYDKKKLYIQFVDPKMRSLSFHYVPVPPSARIHLHEFNNLIRNKQIAEMKKLIQPFILHATCQDPKWLGWSCF